MVKISVIMPVFNDEENLKKSISSILKQTLKDIEIICIDDGSTDDSFNILNRFSEKDNRIKVFTQKNQGSGSARNKGMDEASGEYIAFLDSDDYFVDKNALELMYTEGIKKNINMVSGGIQFIEKGKIELEHRSFKPVDDYTIKCSEEYGIPWYFYKNIFKRSFLVENEIKFPDMSRGQDPIFLAEFLTKIDVFLEVPIIYYSYFTPTVNKLNNSSKYYDYFLHYYEMFKILMVDKRFKVMLDEYLDTLISLEKKEVHVHTKKELFNFLELLDKIKELFVDYGDIDLTKKVHYGFDTLIKKIHIENLKIHICDFENWYDIYSEGILVLDECKHPKISIIIPVYNVEKFLDECLVSVINQTLDDIEIICVNDGSSDDSLNILRNYAQIDDRIVVYSFKNKGLGPTRNRAIKRSHGEYIAFLDSDDWLELDFCEKIYNSAIKHNVDLVLFNAVEEYSNYQKERIYFSEGIIDNPEDFVFDFKWNSDFVLNTYLIACSKLYKTQFLKDNSIEFTDTLFEDIPFHVKTFLKAKKVSYNPQIFYHYRKENNNSIMNSQKNDECYCIFDVMNEVERTIKKINVYGRFESNFLKLKINQFKEKLEVTSDVFKWDFIKKIKKEFIHMNLNQEQLNKLPNRLLSFYDMILNVNSYYEYINYVGGFSESIDNGGCVNNKIFLNSNFWYDKSFTKNEMCLSENIIKKIQNDLLKTNLTNFKAYDSVINENIFDWDFYNKNYNFDESNALLHHIYLNVNQINNPTNFFNSNFYSNEYDITKFKINPFVYYVLYGRFEGKDQVNKNIFIRSINRRMLNREIDKLYGNKVLKEKRCPKLIISLTSFPERMDNIIYTLYSLFNQSILPDKIILCLTLEEFPNMEQDVPLEVLKFKECGLSIKWCDNLRSFTKLIPVMEEFHNDIIVTADDDIYYPKNWLEILFNEHLNHPNDIISHRSRRVSFNEDNLKSYNSWDLISDETDASFLNFLTGVGGVLYPPNSLHDDVFKKEIYQEVCPFADDIWFWIMAIRNNTMIRVPKNCIPYLNYVNALKDLNLSNETSLWALNEGGGNDNQLNGLIKLFPDVLKKLLNDKNKEV